VTNEAQQQRQSYRGTGNRCGYDPNTVELYVPNHDRPRPVHIQEAVKKAGRAFNDPTLLPKLSFMESKGKKNPGKLRLRRGERRQACIKVVQYAFDYRDDITGEVCWPQEDGSTIFYKRSHLNKKTGLEDGRSARALHTTIDTGTLCHRRIGYGKDRRTILSVPEETLQELGTVTQLRKARQEKLAKLTKEAKKAEDVRKKAEAEKYKAYLAAMSDEEKAEHHKKQEKNRADFEAIDFQKFNFL
jgi:hypothetical protein